MDDKAVSDLVAKRTDLRKRRMRSGIRCSSPAGDGAEYDLSWLSQLTKDGNGRFEKTINNVVLIL